MLIKGFCSILLRCLDLGREDWERLIEKLSSRGILQSPEVIRAMREVPREDFLPENMQAYNADDTPLPIGFGQTISAPHSFS